MHVQKNIALIILGFWLLLVGVFFIEVYTYSVFHIVGFIEALENTSKEGEAKISKDEIRNLSLSNHERRMRDLMADLKKDSQEDELNQIMKGIYPIRECCMYEKSNVFLRFLFCIIDWANTTYYL